MSRLTPEQHMNRHKVSSTPRVFFDEDFKTFRLYAGKSLYAFCITPELSLEHLYWGTALPPGYDLRYLSQSSRNAHFNTIEDINFEGRIILEAETLDEIQKQWKSSVKSQTSNKLDELEIFQMRRLENFSWRILSKATQDGIREDTEIPSGEGFNPAARRGKFLRTGDNTILHGSDSSGSGASGTSSSGGNGGGISGSSGMMSSPALSRLGGSGPPSRAEMGPPVRTGDLAAGFRRRSKSNPPLQKLDRESSPEGVGLPLSQSDIQMALNDVAAEQSVAATDHPVQLPPLHPAVAVAVPTRKAPNITRLTQDIPRNISRSSVLEAWAEQNAKTRQRVRAHDRRNQHTTFDRTVGGLGKGVLNVEYADHGTGDFRSPSFMVVDNLTGSNISPLRYRRHAIYRGKVPMPDHMPAVRCVNEREASTLVVTMADTNTGLEVDLIYVAMHDYDAITRRAVFRNVDTRARRLGDISDQSPNCSDLTAAAETRLGNSKVIQKASSITLDFEATVEPFHLVQLSGSWGRERYKVDTKLNPGSHSFGSMRGVSSHIHNPFAAITIGAPQEHQGEAKGFSFIYSGNFLIEAELNEMGRLRLNIGIHHMSLQWNLKPSTAFSTPEAVMTRSGEGLGGMSRTLHRLFLDRLLPRSWSDVDPPILLNSWEAKYFHVNHDNIVEMAHQARDAGINMIVLDDGWFGKRDDDSSSLGDWVADVRKFPQGIKGLAEDVNAAGCRFGIWFEPEMVCQDSLLFTLHPDWYLHVPGRSRQLSRNQMVLDMSRKDVRDYLFNALAGILGTANVEYVKWDMNRPLTEVYSAAALPGEVWQAEVSHRYVLGVYALQERITTAFPNMLLENCASGGGRFDPGMLYYSPQIWCSDNTDALVRMKIQYGTSIAYPTRCIGAHVSTVPNHITGGTTRLRTRGFVAMCGTFGFELDMNSCSPKDVQYFRMMVDLYRAVAPIIRWGDLYRIWDPFQSNFAAWMYVTRDKSQAVVFAFTINSDHWSNLVPRLQLQGLQADAEYEVVEPLPNNIAQQKGNLKIIETDVPVYQLGVNNVCLTGEILMNAGLPIKFFTLDDSQMFVLNRVNDYGGSTGMPTFPSSSQQQQQQQSAMPAVGGLPAVLTKSPSLGNYLMQQNLSSNTLSALAHSFGESAKVSGGGSSGGGRSRGNSLSYSRSNSQQQQQQKKEAAATDNSSDLYMPVPPSMEMTMPLKPDLAQRASSDDT